MYHRIDPTVQSRQKDVKPSTRLEDQGGPDQELASLGDRILAAAWPAALGFRRGLSA